MPKKTDAPIAVVTGSSRGAGRGIAIALGEKGYTVYVTGRSQKPGDAPLPGTIHETAEEVTKAGGTGIPVRVDHFKDAEIKALFEQVDREQGRLDILVNNVAVIHDDLIKPGRFWEKDIHLVDILDVGLRSQYIASYYAAPILIRRKRGLVVFTSSFGSACYMHGPAYGAQKVGVDKFAADMAVDFKPFGVSCVSIWMGMLNTERSRRSAEEQPEQYGKLIKKAETPQFTGRIIAALYEDPELASMSGQALIGAEIAPRYGITDEGRTPPSYRAMLGEPRIPHPAVVR